MLAILSIISYQDIKSRLISWWLLPVLLLSMWLIDIDYSWKSRLEYTLINFAFLVSQYVLLSVYFSIKHKKWQNIADQFLGWGDILFFLMLIVGFSPLHFIMLFVLGLLFSIIAYVPLKSIGLLKQATVPLAGLFSMYLIFVELLAYINAYSFYNDVHIISKISEYYA